VWGGINGLLFHQMLHGVDLPAAVVTFSKSIGHQHVLEPELRSEKGAHDFAQHLLTKAAEQLRRGDYYCRRLGAHLSWVGDLGGWWDETDSMKRVTPASCSPASRKSGSGSRAKSR
jgi:DNA polymerase IV